MSDDDSRDSRDKTMNGDASDKDNICRDYLRNVCRRGKRCKYRHPEAGEAEELGRKIEYIFCHDYQNKECRRGNCKFIHCTREEEEYYRSTGDLPQHVHDAIAMGKGLNQEHQGNRGEVPVCKDFLKGDCRRAGRCKFRHVNSPDYDMDMGRIRRRERYEQFDHFDNFDQYDPVPKRRHIEDFNCGTTNMNMNMGMGMNMNMNMNMMGVRQQQSMPPDYSMLEEENILLRRKLEELKKQIADLTATNEFLLHQNAQLRLGKQTTSVSQAMNPNAMTNPTAVQMPMNNELGGPAPITPAMAPVTVSLAQAIPAVSLAQSMSMGMSGPTTALVSYPIMTQSMRPNMPPNSLAH